MIATLLPILVQLLEMSPQIISGAETVVSSVESIWGVATSSTPPTVQEQATFDAALDAAHAALQAS